MKTRKYTVACLALVLATLASLSCRKGDPIPETSIITVESQVQNDFDRWLASNFTNPYNIQFKYRYENNETDLNYYSVPTDYQSCIKMAHLVKYLCLDTYDEVAGPQFTRKYFPKQFFLMGEWQYKNNGSFTLGTAEGGKKIMLPKTLEDGTKLIWKKGQSGTELMLILLAPLFIWMLYLDQEKKKREKVRERTASIERELPAFNDQLVLLLGSGLILREAFRRIAEGYRVKKVRTYFEDRIVKIWEETENGVSDFVNVLTRTSDDIGVSEFSRIAGVIRDNQLRGFDISGKLAAESEILWDLRKKNAEERGRLAETKLTMPLAILLIVLVLVTAAPAIIQVQGG